jgi:hypothetical protein
MPDQKMQLGRSDWGFRLSREKLYGGSLWSNTPVTVQRTAYRLLLGLALQKYFATHLEGEQSRSGHRRKIEVCPLVA